MTILLLEDDKAIAETLQIYLELCGYRVKLVATVQEAVSVLQYEKPDLLILDYLLNKRTETCAPVVEWVREKWKDKVPRMMILTASAKSEDVGKQLNLPVLRKPFSLEDFDKFLDN